MNYRDMILGIAVGDAMGVPLVGMNRNELLEHPVTTMLPFLDFGCGVWSVPTSLALACGSTISKYGIDSEFLMKSFVDVFEYRYSIQKDLFPLGKTTTDAITKYLDGTPIEKCGGINLNNNGSGSLLMMGPVAYYCYRNKLDSSEVLKVVRQVSGLTHCHDISIIACYLYVMYLYYLMVGKDKHVALELLSELDLSNHRNEYVELFDSILKTNLRDVFMDTIKTTGYVVSTLEAALFVFLNSDNYSQAILGAINLGGETSTIASIVGCMASIYYGGDSIPDSWVTKLQGTHLIDANIDCFEN
ncbi:MAG: ADP-ribosylglycohydrolase family protein [Bacilli bacterium]|nr:ADP-ribosylglycohydrolase family protein [Bacilli bacterium]